MNAPTPVVIALCLAATGCVSIPVHPPTSEETVGVREGRERVVLLRIVGENDDDQGDLMDRFFSRSGFEPSLANRYPFVLRLADLETSGPPDIQIPLVSPTEEARHAGWIYFRLPPGNYWLSLVPPGAVRDSTLPPFWTSTIPPIQGRYGIVRRGEFQPVPGYRLELLEGAGVVYAGTLIVPPSKTWGDGTAESIVIKLRDESALARVIFDRTLRTEGITNQVVRLLEPYGRPLERETIHELVPAGLATIDTNQVTSLDWRKRSMGLWLVQPESVIFAAVPADSSGYAAAGAVMVGLAYAPIGALGGLIHGAISENRWRPVQEQLERELEALRPNLLLGNRFVSAFTNHLHEVPIHLDLNAREVRRTGAAKVASMVFPSVTRIQLRESSRSGRYFVEVGLRVRIWDVRAGRWAYDRAFVYSEFDPKNRIEMDRPYERLMLDSSPARPLDSYLTPEGTAAFRGAIDRAMDLLIDELRDDLGLHDAP